MIIQPKNWKEFGVSVSIGDIDKALRQVIDGIDCVNLSFSGGVDSSLLLYYLLETKGIAKAFTVTNSVDHPDIEYSYMAIRYFEAKYRVHIDHLVLTRPNLEGNGLVKAYYQALKPFLTGIITGDGIDELCCGYYGHQNLCEKTYQGYLRGVQLNHLQPLNDNSGDIEVYLPYIDDRVASPFYRIPLYEKVSKTKRKLVIMKLAKGKVPLEIIERKKYGFGTSVAKAEI